MQVKDENDRLKKDLANAETVMQRSAERYTEAQSRKGKRRKRAGEDEETADGVFCRPGYRAFGDQTAA